MDARICNLFFSLCKAIDERSHACLAGRGGQPESALHINLHVQLLSTIEMAPIGLEIIVSDI